MKKILLSILRVIALVIVYIVLFTVASRLNNPPELMQLFTPEQLNQATTALPVVSLIMTLMLAYLALRSRWHGWKLAGGVVPDLLCALHVPQLDRIISLPSSRPPNAERIFDTRHAHRRFSPCRSIFTSGRLDFGKNQAGLDPG